LRDLRARPPRLRHRAADRGRGGEGRGVGQGRAALVDGPARGVRSPETPLAAAAVAEEVHELRPDYRALLVVVDGITPASGDAASEELLVRAEEHARALLAERPVEELGHVEAWRAAYRAFGAKP